MVFIAAEIGVNWRSLTEAKRMIGLAADAGADGVKFQAFLWEHIKGLPREDELIELIPDKSDLDFLRSMADQAGIEFFATPMYPGAVDMLEAVGVKRYKIRYADNRNSELIAAIKNTGKPYLISCDCGYFENPLPEVISDDHERPLFVYCVPEYPPEKVMLPSTFSLFDTLFKGYSNHYPSIAVPLAAAARGAKYIEVHVKQDKYPEGYRPIDDAVSITFSQLKEFVRLTREIEKVIH